VGEPKSRKARAAKRKLFATRTTVEPLGNPANDEANIAMVLLSMLTDCKCNVHVNLQVTSNKVNGTITITTPRGTDSGQYIRYLEKLTEALNGTVGEDKPQFLPFRRVPTDVSLMVYGILYDSVPDNNADLDTAVKEQFMKLYKVNVTLAKFLKEEPQSKTLKERATSIIVRVWEAEATKFNPSFCSWENTKRPE